MRLANFNLYIPCLIIALFTFGKLLTMPMIVLFGFLDKFGVYGHKGMYSVTWQFYLPYLVTFILVTYIFLKREISPLERKSIRENRYQTGQKLIGLTNIVVALTFVLPIIISLLSRNNENMLYMVIALPVFGIGVFVWLVGLYMVLSSRA